MIVRNLTSGVLKNFDWFNDYRDTRNWVKHYSALPIAERQLLLAQLDAGYAKFLEPAKSQARIVPCPNKLGEALTKIYAAGHGVSVVASLACMSEFSVVRSLCYYQYDCFDDTRYLYNDRRWPRAI